MHIVIGLRRFHLHMLTFETMMSPISIVISMENTCVTCNSCTGHPIFSMLTHLKCNHQDIARLSEQLLYLMNSILIKYHDYLNSEEKEQEKNVFKTPFGQQMCTHLCSTCICILKVLEICASLKKIKSKKTRISFKTIKFASRTCDFIMMCLTIAR